MKEKAMTKVFVAPRRTRKPFLSVFEMVFPKIAACPEPRPGRKPHKGEATKAPKRGFFYSIFSSLRFCFGIFVFVFMEKSKPEAPNNPVRRGRRG